MDIRLSRETWFDVSWDHDIAITKNVVAWKRVV